MATAPLLSVPEEYEKLAPVPLIVRLPVVSDPPAKLIDPPARTLVVAPTSRPLVESSTSDWPSSCPVPAATSVGPTVLSKKVFVPDDQDAGSKYRLTELPLVTNTSPLFATATPFGGAATAKLPVL